MTKKKIYCVACSNHVEASKVSGDLIYPHRPDLASKTFWKCPTCGYYVGSHNDGQPLGTIPTPEVRKARNEVHKTIDDFWIKKKNCKLRKGLYNALSEFVGREYHTGELNSDKECEEIIKFYNLNF